MKGSSVVSLCFVLLASCAKDKTPGVENFSVSDYVTIAEKPNAALKKSSRRATTTPSTRMRLPDMLALPSEDQLQSSGGPLKEKAVITARPPGN